MVACRRVPRRAAPPGPAADALVTVQVNRHEAKLLQALRAAPNRVDMWVARGDPMKKHKELLGLYSRFFEIVNRYDVSYWLEYGSVLGYVRHGGMIPWEWDMDVGVLPEDFQKLQRVAEEVNASDPEYCFGYYKDPDYECAAFSFYLRSDPEVLCDICEYRREGDLLVCAVEEWHYPPHAVEKILPPRAVTMLGQKALVPAQSASFLSDAETILGQCTGSADETQHVKNAVPYMQYDPVPFVLCHLFRPDFIERACGPPVVDIPEPATLKEGFERYATRGLPFIVRGVKAFDITLEAFRARAAADGLTAFGWDRRLEEVAGVPISKALDDWEAGQLKVNFVDSPVPKMVRNAGVHQDLHDVGIDEDKLMLILSAKGTYTPFHQDPIEGADTGGGWMWLERGEKLWNFVDFGDSDHIYDEEARSVADPAFDDLVYANKNALWGRVRQTLARAGDFVYFPPACNHRVWTHKESFGVGGYLRLPSDAKPIEDAMAWYRAKGLDPKLGMFQIVARKRRDALAAAIAAAATAEK